MSDYSVFQLEEAPERWGGQWTEQKLDAFTKYVEAYLTILGKHDYWETIYFDGFAGSGTRKDKVQTVLYEQLKLTPYEEHIYKGAAERVVCLDKSFDYYYFVDKPQSLEKLKNKLELLPKAEGKKMLFKEGDCNIQLRKLADSMRTRKDLAALVFLDPFGMDIEWKSIASLQKTRTDVWILLPTGIVNRLLDRAGKIQHIDRLVSFFGLSEEAIRAEFYKKTGQLDFFGGGSPSKKIEDAIHHTADLYIRQLKSIWTYVTEIPLILCNSRNSPIFYFIFASNNKTAKKIAGQIIENV